MSRQSSRVLLLCVLCAVFGYCQSAVQDVPPAPVSLFADALQLYRTGKFDAALEKYTAALKADPHSAAAYAGMARVYLKQQKVKEAYEAVATGLQGDPNSATLKTALGEVYFRQGKIPEAEHEFVKVINSGVSDPRAYLGAARVRSAVSMHQSAKEMIDKAHALDPADPDIRRFWFLTLKRSDYIRELEGYLAGATNDDADERERMSQALELLKAEQEHPERKCQAVNKPASMEDDLVQLLIDPRHLRGYGLNVKFNGHNSRLLLDTGASGLLVKRSIAEKAKITPVAHSTLRGIGDSSKPAAYAGYVDSIRIGDLELKDCLVRVSETRSVGGEDGLIGADVFSDYLVDIDFWKHKLRLSPLPKRPGPKQSLPPLPLPQEQSNKSSGSAQAPAEDKELVLRDRYVAPEMSAFTPVFRFGHFLLMPTRVDDSSPKLFIIDTGAFNNGISPDAAMEVTKIRRDNHAVLKGLNGKVKEVFRADKLDIRFSHFAQENQEMVAFDTSRLSKSTGAEISGFLGFAMLNLFEMKIDYRDGLVDFVYNKDRHTN
ncbi:MAG TPA: aspartyl protease family protein [Terriglobales bacterium]|nr:aspartyl protease family protein [Terriglobales bacterium]